MYFIPTVTSIWPRLNLEGIEEVLLTPRSILLPQEPKTLLIDNGCWAINTGRGSLDKLNEHIEICLELRKDPRCIFILPDIEKNPEASLFYLDRFLNEVKPPRFSLVDLDIYLNRTDLADGSEFLSIPARRARQAHYDLSRYHLLGTTDRNGARSWDDLCYDQSNIKEDVLRRTYERQSST